MTVKSPRFREAASTATGVAAGANGPGLYALSSLTEVTTRSPRTTYGARRVFRTSPAKGIDRTGFVVAQAAPDVATMAPTMPIIATCAVMARQFAEYCAPHSV